MKSVFCNVCGGDKKIGDEVTQWQCSYCGATHTIHIEEKVVKKKKVKIKPKVENEDVGRQEELPEWGAEGASNWDDKEEE